MCSLAATLFIYCHFSIFSGTCLFLRLSSSVHAVKNNRVNITWILNHSINRRNIEKVEWNKQMCFQALFQNCMRWEIIWHMVEDCYRWRFSMNAVERDNTSYKTLNTLLSRWWVTWRRGAICSVLFKPVFLWRDCLLILLCAIFFFGFFISLFKNTPLPTQYPIDTLKLGHLTIMQSTILTKISISLRAYNWVARNF